MAFINQYVIFLFQYVHISGFLFSEQPQIKHAVFSWFQILNLYFWFLSFLPNFNYQAWKCPNWQSCVFFKLSAKKTQKHPRAKPGKKMVCTIKKREVLFSSEKLRQASVSWGGDPISAYKHPKGRWEEDGPDIKRDFWKPKKQWKRQSGRGASGAGGGGRQRAPHSEPGQPKTPGELGPTWGTLGLAQENNEGEPPRYRENQDEESERRQVLKQKSCTWALGTQAS